MKNCKNYFFILVFLFINFTNVQSDESVAFVNIDYLIKNINVGKIALENISKEDKKNIDILKKKNEDLKKLELEIKQKQNIISEDAFKKEVNSLKKKAKEFNKEKDTLVKEFNIFKNKELNNVFKTINPIIRKYMSDNSISVLLDTKNIFIGDVNADITEQLVKIINQISSQS